GGARAGAGGAAGEAEAARPPPRCDARGAPGAEARPAQARPPQEGRRVARGMGKLAHAARSKPGSATKPRGAPPQAKAKPTLRPKASWTFGGFDGGASLAAVGAQPKMEVSKPQDALELEADRIADRVMHGHAGGPGGARHDGDEMHGGHGVHSVQRKA